MIICIHRLDYLLRGWYLIRSGDHPEILISVHEDTEKAIDICRYILASNGIESLSTIDQLIESLKEKDEQLDKPEVL